MTHEEKKAAERAADLAKPFLQRQECRNDQQYRPLLLEPVIDREKLKTKAKLVKKIRQLCPNPLEAGQTGWAAWHAAHPNASEYELAVEDDKQNAPVEYASEECLDNLKPATHAGFEASADALDHVFDLIDRFENSYHNDYENAEAHAVGSKDGLDAANDLSKLFNIQPEDPITIWQLVDEAWTWAMTQKAAAMEPTAKEPAERPTPASFDTYEDYEALYDSSALVLSREKWLLLKTDPENWESVEVRVVPADEPAALEQPATETTYPRSISPAEYQVWWDNASEQERDALEAAMVDDSRVPFNGDEWGWSYSGGRWSNGVSDSDRDAADEEERGIEPDEPAAQEPARTKEERLERLRQAEISHNAAASRGNNSPYSKDYPELCCAVDHGAGCVPRIYHGTACPGEGKCPTELYEMELKSQEADEMEESYIAHLEEAAAQKAAATKPEENC